MDLGDDSNGWTFSQWQAGEEVDGFFWSLTRFGACGVLGECHTLLGPWSFP
jgi:hypothetical protein